MNKKVLSEFAVGVIVLVSITVGGIFWMKGKKQTLEKQYALQSQVAASGQASSAADKVSQDQPAPTPAACRTHYYEGEAKIRGWLSSENNDPKQLRVQIESDDVKNLPAVNADSQGASFVATLIDPTEQVRSDLQKATVAKPATLTIRGYAQICQDIPLVSLEQATVAFKKA